MFINLKNVPILIIIPNTAVFGPTNFIGTTIASTARMKKRKISEFRFLNLDF